MKSTTFHDERPLARNCNPVFYFLIIGSHLAISRCADPSCTTRTRLPCICASTSKLETKCIVYCLIFHILFMNCFFLFKFLKVKQFTWINLVQIIRLSLAYLVSWSYNLDSISLVSWSWPHDKLLGLRKLKKNKFIKKI